MFKKFLSPSDSSGGGDGSGENQSDASKDQSNQQDYKVKYEQLQATYAKDLEKAEERRQGLQSTYTKEQDAHKMTKQSVEELKKQMSVIAQEKDTIFSNLSQLEKDKMEKDKEIETLRRKDVRAKLIFGKYPQLATFEADGLLPETTEDKLDEVFGNFLTKLGSIQDKSKQDFGKGGTGNPPLSKDKEPDTKSVLAAKMRDAVLAGNFKEYNALFNQSLELKET